LGTQCLSKVKSDTTKTLKSYAKKHFMKNLWSKKIIFTYFYRNTYFFQKMLYIICFE
jgi:hypothetical protein